MDSVSMDFHFKTKGGFFLCYMQLKTFNTHLSECNCFVFFFLLLSVIHEVVILETLRWWWHLLWKPKPILINSWFDNTTWIKFYKLVQVVVCGFVWILVQNWRRELRQWGTTSPGGPPEDVLSGSAAVDAVSKTMRSSTHQCRLWGDMIQRGLLQKI